MESTQKFIETRDKLLRMRGDLAGAQREFQWPRLEHFNWAQDYFDVIAENNPNPALRVVDDSGGDETLSYAELSSRSSQLSNFLAALGIERSDRVLLMLGNVVPLWEMTLAAIKSGVVLIPATTLLERQELQDRLDRGRVKAVVTHDHLVERFAGLCGAPIRIAVGEPVPGWYNYGDVRFCSDQLVAPKRTRADDLFLLYFTSGTTARPKLVAHTHASYPVGHLSTMYWLGLRPGDLHLNLSSPGWAKHAWSSVFAPWNAQSTVLAYQYERFDATSLLDQLVRCKVTTFCAPPTVWRLLIQQDLSQWHVHLRELASAGEPLNPEVIERVQKSWGLTIRDGYGQTETTAQIGNPPGEAIKPGSMGKPLPGYSIALIDAEGRAGDEGEICIELSKSPLALTQAYLEDVDRTAHAMRDGYFHTGDIAARDEDGYLTFIGRTDDVFKSSDYRISPFELESVLIEHPWVAEAAVVPSPDPMRLAVPKAFVVLVAGCAPDAQAARAILGHVRERVAPYKRVRRIEFAALPKTISGKIRRVELRSLEYAPRADARRPQEFWEEDLN